MPQQEASAREQATLKSKDTQFADNLQVKNNARRCSLLHVAGLCRFVVGCRRYSQSSMKKTEISAHYAFVLFFQCKRVYEGVTSARGAINIQKSKDSQLAAVKLPKCLQPTCLCVCTAIVLIKLDLQHTF